VKINNNVNNSSKINFNGAFKLSPNDGYVCINLLKKFEPKFLSQQSKVIRDLKINEKTNCFNLFLDEQNVNTPRVEKYITNLIRNFNIKNYMHWNKANISEDEFTRFANVKISSDEISKNAKIFGAYKMIGGMNSEVAELKNIIARQNIKTIHNNDQFIIKSLQPADVNGRIINIPVLQSNYSHTLLSKIKEFKHTDYVFYNKPLTVEEFNDFAKARIYA